MPPPLATQVRGSSAICTGKPVSCRELCRSMPSAIGKMFLSQRKFFCLVWDLLGGGSWDNSELPELLDLAALATACTRCLASLMPQPCPVPWEQRAASECVAAHVVSRVQRDFAQAMIGRRSAARCYGWSWHSIR